MIRDQPGEKTMDRLCRRRLAEQDADMVTTSAVAVGEEWMEAPIHQPSVPVLRGGEVDFRGGAGFAVPVHFDRAPARSVFRAGGVQADDAARLAGREMVS